MKKLMTDIEDNLFYQFKMKCLENKKSMKSVINGLIDQWIQEMKKKSEKEKI